MVDTSACCATNLVQHHQQGSGLWRRTLNRPRRSLAQHASPVWKLGFSHSNEHRPLGWLKTLDLQHKNWTLPPLAPAVPNAFAVGEGTKVARTGSGVSGMLAAHVADTHSMLTPQPATFSAAKTLAPTAATGQSGRAASSSTLLKRWLASELDTNAPNNVDIQDNLSSRVAYSTKHVGSAAPHVPHQQALLQPQAAVAEAHTGSLQASQHVHNVPSRIPKDTGRALAAATSSSDTVAASVAGISAKAAAQSALAGTETGVYVAADAPRVTRMLPTPPQPLQRPAWDMSLDQQEGFLADFSQLQYKHDVAVHANLYPSQQQSTPGHDATAHEQAMPHKVAAPAEQAVPGDMHTTQPTEVTSSSVTHPVHTKGYSSLADSHSPPSHATRGKSASTLPPQLTKKPKPPSRQSTGAAVPNLLKSSASDSNVVFVNSQKSAAHSKTAAAATAANTNHTAPMTQKQRVPRMTGCNSIPQLLSALQQIPKPLTPALLSAAFTTAVKISTSQGGSRGNNSQQNSQRSVSDGQHPVASGYTPTQSSAVGNTIANSMNNQDASKATSSQHAGQLASRNASHHAAQHKQSLQSALADLFTSHTDVLCSAQWRELSSLLWAAARLQIPLTPQALDPVLEQIWFNQEQPKMQSVTYTMYSLSILYPGYLAEHAEGFLELVDSCSDTPTASQSTELLWALSHANVALDEFGLAWVTDHVYEMLPQYGPDELLRITTAAAHWRAVELPSALLRRIVGRAAALREKCSGRTLAQAVWELSGGQRVEPKLLSVLLRTACRQQGKKLGARDVCMVLQAMVRMLPMKARIPVFNEALRRLIARWSIVSMDASPQTVSTVLHSLSQLDIHLTDMEATTASLMAVIRASKSFNSIDLSMVLQAVAAGVLQLQPGDLDTLLSSSVQGIRTAKPQELACVIASCAKLHYRPQPDWMQIFCEAINDYLPHHETHNKHQGQQGHQHTGMTMNDTSIISIDSRNGRHGSSSQVPSTKPSSSTHQLQPYQAVEILHALALLQPKPARPVVGLSMSLHPVVPEDVGLAHQLLQHALQGSNSSSSSSGSSSSSRSGSRPMGGNRRSWQSGGISASASGSTLGRRTSNSSDMTLNAPGSSRATNSSVRHHIATANPVHIMGSTQSLQANVNAHDRQPQQRPTRPGLPPTAPIPSLSLLHSYNLLLAVERLGLTSLITVTTQPVPCSNDDMMPEAQPSGCSHETAGADHPHASASHGSPGTPEVQKVQLATKSEQSQAATNVAQIHTQLLPSDIQALLSQVMSRLHLLTPRKQALVLRCLVRLEHVHHVTLPNGCMSAWLHSFGACMMRAKLRTLTSVVWLLGYSKCKPAMQWMGNVEACCMQNVQHAKPRDVYALIVGLWMLGYKPGPALVDALIQKLGMSVQKARPQDRDSVAAPKNPQVLHPADNTSVLKAAQIHELPRVKQQAKTMPLSSSVEATAAPPATSASGAWLPSQKGVATPTQKQNVHPGVVASRHKPTKHPASKKNIYRRMPGNTSSKPRCLGVGSLLRVKRCLRDWGYRLQPIEHGSVITGLTLLQHTVKLDKRWAVKKRQAAILKQMAGGDIA